MESAAHAEEQYVAVPLASLVGDAPLEFPLFLDTGDGQRVLYRGETTDFGEAQVRRLGAEGVERLFIRARDRGRYGSRVERSLGRILRERAVPVETRAEVLNGVATQVVEELFVEPRAEAVARARRLVADSCRMVLHESGAFAAIRGVLGASGDLVHHSLTVGFLAIGVARRVMGADPTLLLHAGVAGLLHDVGRIGGDDADEDPEHTTRGFEILRGLGVPPEIAEVALYHHERQDGSGFPRGLTGERVPMLARVIGVVDAFDRIRTSGEGGSSVFESLEVLARGHGGCLDERVACALVSVFAR